jgi:tetratricopeptide (TPR) repeat protein
MKAKTVKRLAILIAVLSLVGGTGFYTQQVRVEQTARAEIKKADEAAAAGDFSKAEERYRLHLQVFPDDVDIQIKYADAILKVDSSLNRQEQAVQIYEDILKRKHGNEDARRRLMKLKIETKHFFSRGKQDEGADSDLKILLQKFPKEGELLFLLGQCYEEGGNDKLAAEKYQEAIDHRAPQRIEAYQRRARLLRGDELDQPEEADRLIKAMVDADPDNYQVYLARWRYRLSLAAKTEDPSSRQSLLSDAQSDFDEAVKRASGEPEVCLELAKIAENKSQYDEAVRILEEGLKVAPTSAALYEQLANVYLRSRNLDKAIEILERGLPLIKPATEQARLLVVLAEWLAGSGKTTNTAKLYLRIQELKNLGYPPVVEQWLTARYYINKNNFEEARKILTLIQPTVNRKFGDAFKAQINLLLAQCYRQLGESEKEREAMRRAHLVAPKDLTMHLTWLASLLGEGKTEEAIKEYRAIVDRAPQVRLILAKLLIARNKQRPERERDWSEVESLIAANASPESAVLRAECLVTQRKFDAAREELEKARKDFPKSVELWTAQATVLGLQERVKDGLSLLDDAKGQLGDHVDLRIARARLWAMQKGPEVAKALLDLAKDIQVFPKKEDRRKLLSALAAELGRQQDLEGASRLWSQLAAQEPKDMELRLNLLDLEFQIGRKDEIEKNIKRIEEIEEKDGLMGRYCQARYLIWQAAKRAGDSNTRETQRKDAREILKELMSRRADWSLIPIALAQLEEQELDQEGLKDEEKQAKEENIIGFYLQAIKLGHRPSAVLRRAVLLLIKNNRGREALELLNSIPVESQLAGDLGRQAARFAVENRDFQGAEQIARKAVEARPGEFSERLWLVWILLASGRQGDAEAELRQAVDLAKTDPERWVNLVNVMVITKQTQKAEKAIQDAQANLPPSQATSLALAQCCEIMGKASKDEATTKWYGEANEWYKKEIDAQPNDLSIKRRLTEFFLRTKQMSDAKAQLNAIRKLGDGVKAAETKAWARRTLASVLASGTDKQQLLEALYCFEPNDRPAAAGQEGRALEDPEDLRVLARVLDAQQTVLQRKRAIEILESLADKHLAKPEDRFLLAQLYEQSGEWPKAREKYRDLNVRTKILPDMDTLSRRPYYLARFADSLLRHHQSGDEQNLAEVQELVDEIKQLQPTMLGTVLIQVKLDQARNQLDEAEKRIRAFADYPDLTPQTLEALADEAEKLGRFELAKQLYDRRQAMPDVLRGKVRLAAFLGRRGLAKEALDICEPLWANTRDFKVVAAQCIDILFGANSPRAYAPEQLNRVGGWLDRALAQAQNERSTTSLLLVGLANVREQQGRYQDAETLYRRAIEQDDHDGVSCNNLAWLTALKDNKPKEALDYINRAIALQPNQPDFLDTRGIVNLTAGDIQGAIRDLTKAIEIDRVPAKLFHLAQAHLANKDKEKAKQYLDEARTKKGLTPSGLHALERPAYEKMLNDLATP